MIHPMAQSPHQSTSRLKPSSNRVVLSNAGSSLMSPSIKQSASNAARKTFMNDAASPRTALNQSMQQYSLTSPSNAAEETPLFKTSRAKKLFQQFDTNSDRKLSKSEFDAGLRSLVQSINAAPSEADNPTLNDLNISFTQHITEAGDSVIDPLTQAQLDALFKEADYDGDQSISLQEFLWRFAGGALPVNPAVKQTLILQTIKPPIKDLTKVSVEDVRNVLEAVYDGPKVRYKTVDLTKIEQVSNAGLKRILVQTLQAEKDESAAEKRPMEEWAAHVFRCSGLTQKDVDRLFAQLDTKRTGRVDLGPFFAACQLRPSRRSKKKANGANAGYLLTTVPANHARDWVNDLLFSYCCQHVSELHAGASYPYKCHPPLPHWGAVDSRTKSLDVKRGETGYKTFLFLSERTKIRAIIKKLPTPSNAPIITPAPAAPTSPATDRRTNRQRPGATTTTPKSKPASTPKSNPVDPNHVGFHIYVSFRTELTEFKRCEYFYHARIELATNESYRSMIPVLCKSWRDGELDTIAMKQPQTHTDEEIEWTKYCGVADEEEYSIPPLGTGKRDE